MIGKRYTAQYKRSVVEEYLQGPKRSMADFAMEKGIADSTFNDWVLKYQKLGAGFLDVTQAIVSLDPTNVIDSTPIGIVRRVDDADRPLPPGIFRIICNGATIELTENLLERAMRIIREW